MALATGGEEMARVVGLVIEEIIHFLVEWCDLENAWHQYNIDSKIDGPTGLTRAAARDPC